MRCNNCFVVAQQLNESTVFKRVPEVKVWRREGKMLVYAPDSGGSALVEEAEQVLYRQLNAPRTLADLTAAGNREQVVACLQRWHRQGVVQMLGKTWSNPQAQEPCLQVRWRGQTEADGQAALPMPVGKALASRGGQLAWEQATPTDWAGLSRQTPEKKRVLEVSVTSAAAVEELAELWEQSREMGWQRLLIHAHLDKPTCAALVHLLKPGTAEAIPAEVMAYCPAIAWDDYRCSVGELMREGVACLPVGCLEEAGQFLTWLECMLAARYRTIGVSQRNLLQGDVLRDKERLNDLAQTWTAVMGRVEAFHREEGVRLRVYPLERLLLALIGAKSGVKRVEAQSQKEGKLRWLAPQPQGRACERCALRLACPQLEGLEVGNVNCWLRKALAEELLWRWHSAPECWQDAFRRGRALD